MLDMHPCRWPHVDSDYSVSDLPNAGVGVHFSHGMQIWLTDGGVRA